MTYVFVLRESIENLCQEAQSLSEAGQGSGGEVRMTGQLQMEHQALLKAARERLRGCQESQAFGETLQGVWAWLEEIQERLGTVDSTMGAKEQLEQRLETVQVRGTLAPRQCKYLLPQSAIYIEKHEVIVV